MDLLVCKEMTRGYAGNKWTFGAAKEVIVEYLWTWEKQDMLYFEGDTIKGVEKCE